MTVQLVVNPANAFTQEERNAFVALVKKAPQVNKATLPGFVDGAHFLAFLRLNGTLVGTGAIKNNRPYQRKLERNDKAGVSLRSEGDGTVKRRNKMILTYHFSLDRLNQVM